jgi:hypothetical protein
MSSVPKRSPQLPQYRPQDGSVLSQRVSVWKVPKRPQISSALLMVAARLSLLACKVLDARVERSIDMEIDRQQDSIFIDSS